MPLIREWNIGTHGLAAIWKVEEPESFFSNYTGLQSDIGNDRRRVEFHAGRFLLKHLEEDFPLLHIEKDEHDKPRLPGDHYYFSISHSWPYIAVMIDPYDEAGIDIQTWHPNIRRIQHKYLSPAEQEFFRNDPQLLTLAWCAKEATYKWNGKRGVDFIEHLPIQFFNEKSENKEITIYFNLSAIPQMITIQSLIFPDFACSYIQNVVNWAIY